MALDTKALEKMTEEPAPSRRAKQSTPSLILNNFSKIEAARANGWTLAAIAETFGVSAGYLSVILRRAAKRQAKVDSQAVPR